MVPFAGRIVVAKLSCGCDDAVRLLVNEKEVQLPAPCPAAWAR